MSDVYFTWRAASINGGTIERIYPLSDEDPSIVGAEALADFASFLAEEGFLFGGPKSLPFLVQSD